MPRLLPRPTDVMPDADDPDTVSRTDLHPWAWWSWALACAVLANLVGNLLLLSLLAAAILVVVLANRGPQAWRRGLGFYLALAGVIIAMRLVFRIVLGGTGSGPVLLDLPELELPEWAAGISIGGPLTLGELQFTLTDAARLAVLVLALGAANCLADPRTALRSVPAALHDVSVAIVITLTVLPQLIASTFRINRGRRLRRRNSRGLRAVAATLVPVLEDAVEGAMALATSMEARGFGRTREQRSVGRGTGLALVGAALAMVIGVFWLLGVAPTSGRVLGVGIEQWIGLALLGTGTAVGVVSLLRSGRRLAVTRYRPQPWARAEWALLALAVSLVVLTCWWGSAWGAPTDLRPSGWPTLTAPAVILPLVAVLPAAAALPVPNGGAHHG